MQDEPWTVGRLLAWTTEYFQKREIESPRLEAEILLAAARDCRRIDLYATFGDETTQETRVAFRELVRRRAEGTPVAYLVGHREFYSLDFLVTPDVLIPRPETELIVVALLDLVKARPPSGKAIRIADMGAGSGILAVCGAKFVPKSIVTAIDVSAKALAVAGRNAERHGVADRIRFVESDLFANIPADERFEYILSNPPYVSTAEMKELATDVREHEPHLALHAGEHGTDVIERLIPQAAERLLPGGVLLMEISPMIAERVQQQIVEQTELNWVKAIRDHAGHARVVEAVKESS